MGGAVSTGEDNDDLVDNLVEHSCITTPLVERVFRAVDRGDYFTEECRDAAYKDVAWRLDNLHLSAPCIYSSVMENLDLKPGNSFLNIGSGTGYVNTMAGLLIGSSGVNHGVELFADVVDYARKRLEEFLRDSPAVDEFDFCPPEFVVGNGLCIEPGRQYDRVYCGACCPAPRLYYLKQLLKIGGVLVVPVNDRLERIERTGDHDWETVNKLSVSFAQLIEPDLTNSKTGVTLPAVQPRSLQLLCRSQIRHLLRETVLTERPDLRPDLPPPSRRRRRRPRVSQLRAQRNRIRDALRPHHIGQLLIPLRPPRADRDADDEVEQQRFQHLGHVLYNAVLNVSDDEWDRSSAEEMSDDDGDSGSDEGIAAGEPAPGDSPAVVGDQQEEVGNNNTVPEPAPADRSGVKRSAEPEEEGDELEGAPGGAGSPGSQEKRGRRDKLDSGLGDSDDAAVAAAAPAAAAETVPAERSDTESSASERENGLAAADRESPPLALLPPDPGRDRLSEEEEEEEEKERADRRSTRETPPGKLISELLVAKIDRLPLPHTLRVFVNMDRPLPSPAT